MDFGTQSSSGSQNQTTQPTLPPELSGILGGKSATNQNIPQELRSFLRTMPSLASYITNMPTEGVAPLTAGQSQDINAIQSQVSNQNPFALNAEEAPAMATYENLAGGANPAVAYGQKVFNDITAPTVESQMALAGLGNSGAAGENLALAGEQMALPMAEEGYQMEPTAAAGMANLGNTAFQQGTTNMQNALTAAGIPQQVAQQVLTNQYNTAMNKTQAGTNVEETIMNWLPQLIGGKSVSVNSGGGTNLGFGI